jgi:arylsulfatase A-like enzyme
VKPADVRVPAYLPDTPEIRGELSGYYNLMEKMDGQMAEVLAELTTDGLAEDTIVFYFGDNGGLLPGAKRHCHDQGLRVPLIVYVPPKWMHLSPGKAGAVIENPVTLMDVSATSLALAGLSKPAQMQGDVLFGSKEAKLPTYAFGARNRMDERYDITVISATTCLICRLDNIRHRPGRRRAINRGKRYTAPAS